MAICWDVNMREYLNKEDSDDCVGLVEVKVTGDLHVLEKGENDELGN